MNSFTTFFRATPLLLSTVLLSSCAKGPTGEPTIPVQALNRLTVRMTVVRPITNAQFIYAFAFDDDGDSSDGPTTFTSSNFSPNGVVAGSFTVLVLYENGQFNAYRRTATGTGNSTTETLERVPNAFTTDINGRSQSRNGSSLNFTLNLDATVPSDGSRLFRGVNGVLPDLLQLNFIATTPRRRDPNDQRTKSFDSFGRGFSSVFATLNIRTTQSFNNRGNGATNAGVDEPVGDVFLGDSDINVTPETLDQIDISDFQIDVLRRNQ